MQIPRWLEGKRVHCPSCKDITNFSEATGRPSEENQNHFEYRCRKCDKLIRLTKKPTPKKPVPEGPGFSEDFSSFFSQGAEFLKSKNKKE